MSITASMVKELREATGAGMMDAKTALTETNGDMEAAVDWLRTKGLAKAAKKQGRTAAEGLVAVVVAGGTGAVVEVNSETDFVSRNENFQAMVGASARAALGVSSLEALKAAGIDGQRVEDVVTSAIATIGENMTLRRMARLSGETVVSYVHNAAAEGMGKIGVLVALSGEDRGIGRQIAMHVAAANPAALSEADMDPAVMAKELAVQTAKALEENASSAKPKPEAVIHNNVIPGRMRKFVAESTLLNQAFVVEPDVTVGAAAESVGVTVTGFVRFEVGEGIEKVDEDFAAEVAKMAKG
jgi:elongation factor Ts